MDVNNWAEAPFTDTSSQMLLDFDEIYLRCYHHVSSLITPDKNTWVTPITIYNVMRDAASAEMIDDDTRALAVLFLYLHFNSRRNIRVT